MPELEETDPVLKMAVIHFQFESIHPFYDGVVAGVKLPKNAGEKFPLLGI